ncbi:nuclear transcription factor Y subunit gamma isoform X9 [Trichonephila clavipes]|nr:nuclear transcription factor Y subunit gamma isoform X9 [Trichonephila clavipes]
MTPKMVKKINKMVLDDHHLKAHELVGVSKSMGAVFQQANQQLTQQQQAQAVYQIQQVAQASGQVATSGTPVFLTQAPGGGTTVQIQAVATDQHSSTDEEQQQSQ